jgi:hypothetical protein
VADDQTFHDAIEGYGEQLSFAPGETAELHISTTADSYDIVVERWGATREEVWRAEGVVGIFHSVPDDADSSGCNWPVGVEVPVGHDWRSGFYLVTLTAHGVPADRATAHACFVVRSGANQRRALYVLPTNTWHAYNTWGGRSLYTGGTRVSFARPFGRGILCRPEVERDDRKARPVRFREEPDADGSIFQAYRTEHHYPAAIGSTGWFTHGRRFVEWAEGAGYEFDYAVSSDLETDPSIADGYELIVGVGHDEYWSASQRTTVEAHIKRGGHLATFSGNTSFWQVRLETDERGTHMVCHKYGAHTSDPILGDSPELMAGMFADPVVDRPEWTFLGAGSAFGLYHRFGRATARGVGGFLVYRDDHWMLADTGLGYGDVLGADDGVVGYETVGCPLAFDELQLPIAADYPGLPADIEIIGFCPASNLRVGEYPKSISALSDQGDLEFIAERVFAAFGDQAKARARHGNAVMLTCRPFGDSSGEVVTIGTTDWVFGLAHDKAVKQVTKNVLDRLT